MFFCESCRGPTFRSNPGWKTGLPLPPRNFWWWNRRTTPMQFWELAQNGQCAAFSLGALLFASSNSFWWCRLFVRMRDWQEFGWLADFTFHSLSRQHRCFVCILRSWVLLLLAFSLPLSLFAVVLRFEPARRCVSKGYFPRIRE